MSDTAGNARLIALRSIANNGGTMSIDLMDGMDAVYALRLGLDLAADGLCTHTRVSGHIGMFTITDKGRATLETAP